MPAYKCAPRWVQSFQAVRDVAALSATSALAVERPLYRGVSRVHVVRLVVHKETHITVLGHGRHLSLVAAQPRGL